MDNSIALISKAADTFGRLFCVRLRLILGLAVTGLALAAISAPMLDSTGLSIISGIIYRIDGMVCHQISGRCLHIDGLPVAVCARCLGAYIGFVIASMIFTTRLNLTPAVRPAIMLIGVMAVIDVGCQIAHLYDTGNILRLASGAALGFGLGMPVFRFVSSVEISCMTEFSSAVSL